MELSKWQYFGVGLVLLVFVYILLHRNKLLNKLPFVAAAKARFKEIFSKVRGA